MRWRKSLITLCTTTVIILISSLCLKRNHQKQKKLRQKQNLQRIRNSKLKYKKNRETLRKLRTIGDHQIFHKKIKPTNKKKNLNLIFQLMKYLWWTAILKAQINLSVHKFFRFHLTIVLCILVTMNKKMKQI